MILFHVHDRSSRPPPSRRLAREWTAVALPLGELDGFAAANMRHCLFDVDVTAPETAVAIRRFLDRSGRLETCLFACRRGDRHAATQAWSLGATNLVDRPMRDEALADLPSANEAAPASDGGQPVSAVVATVALDGAFRAILADARLATEGLGDVAGEVDRDIRDLGVSRWLQPIRAHHVGTYQHCLLVTGLATSFGQELGLAPADRSTLTLAALLHDVGKARIDGALLDKPGSLTAAERRLFELHPVWGNEFLAARSDLAPEIRDVVRHHHEYLDGSGYPDGLAGREISDLTRLVTIADVFGALVERRSYKPPMPPDEAYATLVEMVAAGRLERSLVVAFEAVVRRLVG